MEIISSKTIKPDLFTGLTAQRDFEKQGYINISFTITNYKIGVSVAGFSVDSCCYICNPKTKKQIADNIKFIDKYVNSCINSNELKNQLNITL